MLNLVNALFIGAFLCGTEFDHSELCFASFDGAVLYDCAMKNVCAEETSFKSTGFEECSLYGAVMTHSNFSGAKFTKTELHSAKLQNCCIDGTRFEGSDTGQANMEHCSYNEQDWSEPSGPVLSM